MRIKKWQLVCAILFLPVLANAVPVDLTLESPATELFQQTQNNPAVIADPSPNNPVGWDHTVIPPNTAAYSLDSPIYTIQQIRDIVGDQFWVGIDVNVAQNTHELRSFSMTIDGVVEFLFSGPADLSVVNNGNGWSDNLLKGFDISGLDGSLEAFFTAAVGNADDGREQFFLISSDAEAVIPEPATLALVGMGLGFGGLMQRRKRLRSVLG